MVNKQEGKATALVHLASGIGNIVLSTPLLIALNEMGFVVDVLLHADYSETADILQGWSVVRKIYTDQSKFPAHESYDYLIPAFPPFYRLRIAHLYGCSHRVIRRPADTLFYKSEQEYYLAFARELGYRLEQSPVYRLPIGPSDSYGVTGQTLVIAPGCKTGEMAAKRWPYFAQLAEAFKDVVVVGLADDLLGKHGETVRFPSHVRSFIGKLTLRETAELLSSAGAVVGNDSGLPHIAAAVGTPTLMLFGPTPHLSLGHLPPNVKVSRAGLFCEPCWFTNRFQACGGHIHCMREIRIEDVRKEINSLAGLC